MVGKHQQAGHDLGTPNGRYPIELSTLHYLAGERQNHHVGAPLATCGAHLKILGR
jgi:hypothetical protein